jgi:hypothetical protein
MNSKFQISNFRLFHGTWLVALALGARFDGKATTWTFDGDPVGKVAKGFTAATGEWAVVADGDNRVLAQRAKSPDATFNVALADDSSAKDLVLSVRLKPIEGEDDRGGGLVWRAKDAKNYYIARYNPLEDNFRVYKVVDGERTQLGTIEKIADVEGWHALKVTMAGRRIRCELDGEHTLDAEDGTFGEAGKVGLWTKADARTWFDDLKLEIR